MKSRAIAIAMLAAIYFLGFASGYKANRQHANIEAFWIGFETGQHDALTTKQAAQQLGETK